MDVLITGSTGMVGKSVLHECIKDDRTSKTTKCLMNQRFMRMTNVMINPARKYVVTTKYTLD